jgi:hypothetical protein
MKKIFTLILLCSPLLLSAQIWYIGGKAGATLSNYKTKTPWKEVSNVGYTVGFTAFRQLSSNVGINLELQYIQKGYYHKICNTISDKLLANYVEVPIMFDYAFIIPSLRNVKLHGTLGVYTAYWLSGKYKTEGFDDTDETLDFEKSGTKRFDFGPNGGGRLEYILSNGSISLDFRYELGLLDLQKKINDDTSNTNRALVVGISYLKIIGN